MPKRTFKVEWTHGNHPDVTLHEDSLSMVFAILNVRYRLHVDDRFVISELRTGERPVEYIGRVRYRDIYYSRVLKDGNLGKTRVYLPHSYWGFHYLP